MKNIIRGYLDTTFNIDFDMLENLQHGRGTTQLDRIIIAKDTKEGEYNLNLSLLIMELEQLFDISRNDAFWCMHDWLKTRTYRYVRGGGGDEAEINLKYLLGWFTQMV